MKRSRSQDRLQLVEKASQSFAPYGRERDWDHFRRRRVRRRKYISRSAVSNCPPLADNRGAKRSAGPHRPLAAGGLYCQKRPSRAFFDSLKAALTGGLFCTRHDSRCPRRLSGRRGRYLPIAAFSVGTAKYEIVDVPIHLKSPPNKTAYNQYMRASPEV